MLSVGINCPGRNHTHGLLVCHDPNSAPGHTVGSSSLAVGTVGGTPLSTVPTSIKFPDVYNITFFVNWHMCGQRKDPCFLRDLENTKLVPFLFSFALLVSLVNYLKMLTLAKRLKSLL